MAISITLNEYLSRENINYDLLKHRTTETAFNAATASHLPSSKVVKAVILEDESNNLLMAVVPSDHRLALDEVNNITGKNYQLTMEKHLSRIFKDCEQGAAPGLGMPYGVDMLLDDSLLNQDKIYMEAGDHQHLLAFDHDDYMALVRDVPHGSITGISIGKPKDAESMDAERTL